jgi:hypothetical protein
MAAPRKMTAATSSTKPTSRWIWTDGCRHPHGGQRHIEGERLAGHPYGGQGEYVRRTLIAVLLLLGLGIPALALAYPPATLTSTATTITVAGLDCGTTYEIRVRERRSGSWRDQQTYTKATAACATPTPTPTATPTATATPSPTATPTASPTPSPTATPTPTVTPTPTPTPSGFPDESTTGPTGTLTTYSGPSTITAAGTVIDSKDITTCLVIKATNVTIRNSRISCGSGGGAPIVRYDDDGSSGSPLLIEDTEIDCRVTNGQGVGEADYTLRRVHIHGCIDGLEINRDVLVEDSLITRLALVGSDPHADGAQFGWGHFEGGTIVGGVLNVTFRHNTIYAIGHDGVTLADKTITRNGGGNVDRDVLIERNLLSGGGYTLHCFDGTSPSEVVRDNRFSTRYMPAFGWSDGCAEEDRGGNVVHETDEPLDLN